MQRSSDMWAMFCYEDSSLRACNAVSLGEWFQTLNR